ncbi:prephenate dehydrogenase [Pseudactinotalea sp. HY160]|uniref:prephenate dehydrogenase n=1 Tax=Pseudactinotalea sp. HY160 TaxID=2654490 RepID=UPI001312DF49|nr:prephenate dehydrogenase [Pseudactinotalea sp. HY160]
MTSEPAATVGPVLIIGSGLLGASIGLALTALGVSVRIRDASPVAQALARDLGAGELDAPGAEPPTLVVVATPPDVTAGIVGSALHTFPRAVVTDVASVKGVILEELRDFATLDLSRYVGSHPMAGREKSGASAATGELFAGRPWVICAHEDAEPAAVLAVRNLAGDLGGAPAYLGAREHDDAVALVSHMPQLVASLVAARLLEAPEPALGLAGQGVRDLTRIAASDAKLWTAIITGNASSVRTVMRELRDDLDGLLEALDRAAEDGPLAVGAMHGIAGVISAGNDGVGRIPGKHGGARKRYTEVIVLVPDQPGELGRLFGEVGEIGVNIEDFAMEHSPKQKVGMAIVSVVPAAAQQLEDALTERGWRVVSA